MAWFDKMFPRYTPLELPSAQNQDLESFATDDAAPRFRFDAIGSDFETWNALVGHTYPSFKVSRSEALQVPAIKAARDIFAGRIGSLPIHTHNAGGEVVDRILMRQPEKAFGIVRSVTMCNTLDDLFFYSHSLWYVRERSERFPSGVERVPFSRWDWDKETRQILVDGEKVSANDCILFISSNEPMVNFGRPIRALLAMEALSGEYISRPEMSEYFQPEEEIELTDEEVVDYLDDYVDARKRGTVGYIPFGMNRHETKRMTAEELQLIAAREFCISEVSRMTGISPNWLALNITTRTYSNMQDERRDFIEGPAAPFIKAIEERLSAGDVTPNGQYVKFNLDGYLRANTKERYEAHNLAIAGGWKTVNEIRKLEELPPIDGGDVLKGGSDGTV